MAALERKKHFFDLQQQALIRDFAPTVPKYVIPVSLLLLSPNIHGDRKANVKAIGSKQGCKRLRAAAPEGD